MSREHTMALVELSSTEELQYRRQLAQLEIQRLPEETLWTGYRDYAPDMPLGRALCASWPRDELVSLLMERTRALGHAPSQREMFLFYRLYLKRRFGTWPAALRAAGLHCGMEYKPAQTDWRELLAITPHVGVSLLSLVEQWRTNGMPPTRRQVSDSLLLCSQFGDWNDVLCAAQSLDFWLEQHPTPMRFSCQDHLNSLIRLAEQLGRTPLLTETPEQLRLSLRLGWGSWGRALEAAGLPPLNDNARSRAAWEQRQRAVAGNHSLHIVVSPTPEQMELLENLEQTCLRLGRPPTREELVPALRTELTTAFGSLRNALFQLGRAPSPKPSTKGFRHMGPK